MSIIIKGMDMPKEEGRVLKIFPDGRVAINLNDNVAKAVELPPHGRLIDGDTIWDNIIGAVRHFNYGATQMSTLASVMKMIEAAPTIIEAEEEEQ